MTAHFVLASSNLLRKKIFMGPLVFHDYITYFSSIHTTRLGVINFFITLFDLQLVSGLWPHRQEGYFHTIYLYIYEII
jgi:hypothetical protein